MMLNPRKSAEYVYNNSQYTNIDENEVDATAKQIIQSLNEGKIQISNWNNCKLNPTGDSDDTLNWIFLLDVLNFSFFPDLNCPKWTFKLDGESHTGYMALLAAVKHAKSINIDITNPEFWRQIQTEQFKQIFCGAGKTSHLNNEYGGDNGGGGGEMPLIEKRVEFMNEAGAVLIDKFDGKFSNCIRQCGQSALELVRLIVDNFSSFRDEAEFRGTKIAFYKRAQILVADVWSCCAGQGLAAFTDIDQLTAFADYRVPQALNFLKVLRYNKELTEILQNGQEIANGSEHEVEIRGATLHAIERIVQRVRELLQEQSRKRPLSSINSVLVDYYLWEFRRDHAAEIDEARIPMHRTRCTFY